MKNLRLSKNQFGDRTGIILGSVLAANDYIEVLDMSWNMIRGPGAVTLAKGLKVGNPNNRSAHAALKAATTEYTAQL